MASQITSLTIVNSNVHSGADQGKRQSSASLAFVRGIHRRPVNSPHKWPVTRKMIPFDDVIMPSSMTPYGANKPQWHHAEGRHFHHELEFLPLLPIEMMNGPFLFHFMMDILQVGFTHDSVSWWYALIPETFHTCAGWYLTFKAIYRCLCTRTSRDVNESESNKFVITAYVLFLSTDIYIYI